MGPDNGIMDLALLIDFVLSRMWIVVLLGLLHVVSIEHKLVVEFIKNKKRKIRQLWPLMERVSYILLGVLVAFMAFALVFTISNIFFSSPALPQPSSSMLYQSQYIGLVAVIGLIVAGYSLILSAGGRWMVNLAKLSATVSILYLFFAIFAAYM